ncbi:scoloptoxin SSD976-like [Anopheles arabiensis]|uniref:SCP domain-containing protein n=4 Tax=gambiae species complex TaxID=44542 RepID=A0A1S4GPD3_ANOGA|nr:scoloptoxin SSD976-like [Anopheles arabiensis]XP_041769958.1 scoloptoxin SSD976-like [Anopheles merus]XP_041769959.1 scoloptoxin SSD976-like [Anopheles merus]XP_061504680.1 scoloptoxin SSD976 [Anopheles gambiae]
MHQSTFALTLCLLSITVFSTDGYAPNYYCSPSLCPHGGPNVGCNPPPLSGGHFCYGKLPSVVPMTPAVQAHILHLHNYYRSRVASGYQFPLGPAARMYTMVWDDELAAQAGNNARSCVFAHDRCRNTPQFLTSGQNIALLKYYEPGAYTVTDLITRFIGGWWKENKKVKPAYIQAFPRSQVKNIGHFTMLVNDRTWKVGCAMQNWSEGAATKVYFVCNYSYNNIVTQEVYTVGRAGSQCQAGLNPIYPGLCRT